MNLAVVVKRNSQLGTSAGGATVSYSGVAITAKTLRKPGFSATLSPDGSVAVLNLTDTNADYVQFDGEAI